MGKNVEMNSNPADATTSGPSAWMARLMAPVDSAALAYFRIAFGLIMLWEVGRYAYDGGYGSWITRYYIEPQMFFTYFGFDWVKPWAGSLMYVHFAVLGILALCIALGLLYRICAILFFLGFTHVFLIDMSNYLNHFYLISLVSFAMIFVPANRSFALDSLFRPALRSRSIPAWNLWLLRFHVAVPYFLGGVAKINNDWLRGEPMRAWLHKRPDFPVIGQYFHDEWMISIFVYGGLLLDLLIVAFLLWRKTRVLAIVAACSFHLLNAQLFNIGIFPWFMMAATLIFLEPTTLRRLFFGTWGEPTDSDAGEINKELPPDLTRIPRWTLCFFAVYVLIQVAFPFRHWLYPGNVSWTEEGHNFSWHMKLRTKIARARFDIYDPATKRKWGVRPSDFLTKRQARKMPKRPDMIIQYAHWLARKWEHDGYPGVEVRARIRASLNGRRFQNLIDPGVDLTKRQRSIWPADWIVPLTEPLVLTELNRGESSSR